MPAGDLYSITRTSESLRAAARTATVNGTGVDMAGFESAIVVIALGTFAGTTPTATIQIQESDNDSTYTAVATADLDGGVLPAIDTTTDEQVIERGYRGNRRYLRVAITAIGGTGPSLPCAAVVVLGHPRGGPV